MCSDSEKNMSAYADQNHAPSLTDVRLEQYIEKNAAVLSNAALAIKRILKLCKKYNTKNSDKTRPR